MKSIQIEVPATSANLGPGFDSLGLALDIVSTVRVDFREDDRSVVLLDAEHHGLDREQNLLCEAYTRWGSESGASLPGAAFTLTAPIPIGKGLGSSAAAIVAGLRAGAQAGGEKSPSDRILQIASAMEGHADNCAATILGGLTVAFLDGSRAHAIHVANHLGLGVGLFVPSEGLLTARARAALPEHIPRRDAVFNIGRSTYLATALVWGRWELIGPAMQDRMHQPYRGRLIPALEEVIGAAVSAG
ncbi:MAG: homoserine kinase, partial [Chloroflexota bacterium]